VALVVKRYAGAVGLESAAYPGAQAPGRAGNLGGDRRRQRAQHHEPDRAPQRRDGVALHPGRVVVPGEYRGAGWGCEIVIPLDAGLFYLLGIPSEWRFNGLVVLKASPRPRSCRKSVPKCPREVNKLKGFSDEVVDSKPGERDINNFFAIRASNNHFQIDPQSLGLFKDFPAWCPR
jgi:hypothetical protein